MNPRGLQRLIPYLIALLFAGGFSSASKAEGAIDFVTPSLAYYADSREFVTASLGISTGRLPGGFALWGFSDFHGDQGRRNTKLSRSFSEYRLSHGGIGELLGLKGLGAQIEQDIATGKGNDIARFGLTYKHDVALPWRQSGWLQWRLFPYETDRDGGQVSLVFSVPLTQRLHLKGFADYNIAENGKNRWVVEPELNIKLARKLSALIEYRFNGFEADASGVSGSGVAFGLRYRLGS